jgi:anti-sigma B factor antagonist
MGEAERFPGGGAATAVVRLPAEVDAANAARAGEQLRAAFAPGITAVVADLTHTVFCDCAGLRALVLAHEQAAALHIELRLAGPAPIVRRILTLTELDRRLAIYPSLAAACAVPAARHPSRA